MFLKRLAPVFFRVYNDIKSTSQQNEKIMVLSVFPWGPILRIPPLAWRKAGDLISSSNNLVVDVMIPAIPRYHPICALINQFCSLLSTNTSISNTSMVLETFNKEDIFIYSPFRQKIFCIWSSVKKGTCSCPEFFCLLFFIVRDTSIPPS